MSTEQGAVPGGGEPTEEEMRAAYEAELKRLTASDMIAQATVSLLNIGAYRMGPPADAAGAETDAGAGAATGAGAADNGKDLEQVRDAVDGARALLEILERRMPGELGPLRDALSRLQMAYAHEVQTSTPATPPATQPAPGSAAQPAPGSATQPAAGSATQPANESATPPAEQPAQPAETGSAATSDPGNDAGKPSGPGPAEASGRLWVPGR